MGQTRSQQGRLTYHVEQDQQGHWLVRQDGADRSSSTHNSQSDAIDEGKRLAENHRPSMLVSHDSNNNEDQRNTYD